MEQVVIGALANLTSTAIVEGVKYVKEYPKPQTEVLLQAAQTKLQEWLNEPTIRGYFPQVLLPKLLPDLEPTIRGYFQAGADGLDFDGFVGDQFYGYDAPTTEGATGKELEEDSDAFQELKEVFGVFDDDSDGLISVADLKAVITRLGLSDELPGVCKVDENSDRFVDFQEFKHMMTKDATEL